MRISASSCHALFIFIFFTLSACDPSSKAEDAIKIAQIAFDQGRYEEAIKLLTPLIDHDKKNESALLLRAKCFYKMKNYLLQAKDLTVVLSNDDLPCDEKKIYANDIASAYDHYLMNDSAIRYQWIIFKLQDDCDVQGFTMESSYQILSNLYCRKQSYDSALILLDSAIVHGASTYSIARARAQVFSKMNDLDAAIHWTTIAIDSILTFRGHMFEPGWDYQNRADLYHQKGDLKAACADWQKALDLGLKEAKPKLDSFCSGR